MHFEMKIDNDALVKELDRLAKVVPNLTEKAVEKMADVIRPALISAAPYDRSSKRKGKHLKEVIKRGTIVHGRNSARTTIWLRPRGLSGAKKGPRAAKNWDKDKQVYKLVVAEFGRSDLPAKPFWDKTVQSNADKAVNAAIKVMQEEMKK